MLCVERCEAINLWEENQGEVKQKRSGWRSLQKKVTNIHLLQDVVSLTKSSHCHPFICSASTLNTHWIKYHLHRVEKETYQEAPIHLVWYECCVYRVCFTEY